MNHSHIQPNALVVRTTMSIDQRIDHSSCGNDSNCGDDVTTCKADKKRTVSFAPSCQVIRFSDEDGQAYLCHEAIKESSSCIDGEFDHTAELHESTSSGKKKQRVVRFDSSSPVVHLIDNHHTEDRADELWYSQYDYMIFEGEACQCSHFIQDIESQGLRFHGDLGHILGLEKIILWERYHDKRDALRQTVLNEQAVQRLAKNIRTNQGTESDNDERAAKDVGLLHLAKTSARLSRWARECASIAALTLGHDLALTRAQEKSTE